MAFSASDLSALLVGMAGAAGGVYATMTARRSAAQQEALATRAQDKSDFDSVSRGQKEQIDGLRGQIADLRTENAAAEARCETQVTGLQSRILAYTRYVRTLVAEMRRANIPVPDPPDDIDIPIF